MVVEVTLLAIGLMIAVLSRNVAGAHEYTYDPGVQRYASGVLTSHNVDAPLPAGVDPSVPVAFSIPRLLFDVEPP